MKSRSAAVSPAGPRILLFQQGDPDRIAAAGSGSPYFLAMALRRAGAVVTVRDCEPAGVPRAALAARSFALDRRKWVARFNIGTAGLRRRSQIAAAHVEELASEIDFVVQYGSSFSPGTAKPYFCFSDNFISNSLAEPLSWARQLPARELSFALSHERSLFENAAGVFTFSDVVRRAILDHYGLDHERVVVTYPGPNFAEPPDGKRLPSEQPTVLFVGRAWKEKGGPELVKAMELVRRQVPMSRLVVVGPRALPSIPSFVEAHGFLSKDDPHDASTLEQLFRTSWIFALPTRYESFGMSFIEAMWSGLPTIGTDDWAIREIIDDGVTGFRVKLDDVDTLAARIVQVLSDPALRARQSAAARKRAEHMFNWDATARTILRALERRPGRRPV